jgi:WD40 repeat protein
MRECASSLSHGYDTRYVAARKTPGPMQTSNDRSLTATEGWPSPSLAEQTGHWSCECGKTLKFEYQRAGKKGRCPACGRTFTIPPPAPLAGAALTLRGHKGPITAVAISPDRRLVATSADLAAVGGARSELAETVLWDTDAGHVAAVLHWHRKTVTAVAFSPDGQWLATGSQDHAISIWDVRRGLWDAVIGVHEHVLRGHEGPITDVVFSAKEALLASTAADRTIRLWDTQTWQAKTVIRNERGGDAKLAISPCGRYVAAVWTSRGPVTLWKTATGEKHLDLRLWSDEDAANQAVGFSPDGTRLAVLGGSQVRVWELSTCQVLASLEVPGSETLALAPRGNVIATAGHNDATGANVTLWEGSTLAIVREFDGHSQSVSAIAFSPDGRILVSGGRDGVANVWLLD